MLGKVITINCDTVRLKEECLSDEGKLMAALIKIAVGGQAHKELRMPESAVPQELRSFFE